MKNFSILFAALLLSHFRLDAVPLSFETAYQDILHNTYELKGAEIEITAKEADRWQAGTYPNPVLAATLSSVGRDQNGTENYLFVNVTQIVELGGKRSARLRVAGASQCSSQWTVEIVKNELFGKLLNTFIDTAVAQERLTLAEQALQAASAKKEVANSGMEEKKAQVARHAALLAHKRQLSALQKARHQLVSLWDTNPPVFDSVSFPLFQISPPPPLEMLIEHLNSHPKILKAEAEAAFACELVSLEKSKKIPDIAVQVGVSTERFTHEPALTLGVGIPLPLFDRNEGNISRASYEQLQASYKHLDIKTELQASLKMTYYEWTAAYEQASILKDSILPAAHEALQLAQESCQEGKTDLPNLLEIHAVLFDIQQQYLNAVEEYHHKRAEALHLSASCSCIN